MKRRAFTLVELLVVISIIGMLMALLLPAVNAARENGRQNSCLNNIKQLTLAAQQFETAKGRLPGWRDKVPGGPTASWVVMLFPYMERSDLWESWQSGNPAVAEVSTLICPNVRPMDSQVQFGRTVALSYAANCGLPGSNDAEGGVFLNVTGNVAPIDLGYISQNDGTSNTLMFAENVQTWRWMYPMPPANSGDPITDYCPRQNAVGINWHTTISGCDDTADRLPTRVNRCKDVSVEQLAGSDGGVFVLGSDPPEFRYARPSSNHPTLFIASFCDGSARRINEDISNQAYWHIMTPRGRKYAPGSGASVTNAVFDTPWDGKLD